MTDKQIIMSLKLVTLVLFVLKVTEMIDISWVWVLLPVYGLWILAGILFAVDRIEEFVARRAAR
jgi:hypothetical protein